MAISIHPTAIVHASAIIGDGSEVGAYSLIGPRVVLGKRNRVGPHVVLEGITTFGDENEIFQFASLGSKPQDLKYRGEDSTVEIGNRNIIREYVTIQPGTTGGGMRTRIGNGNLFMANAHIGHDSLIGDSNVFANSAGIAGHVTIGNWVMVGGLSAIHQFVRIGDLSFLGGGTMVVQDIPPYCIAQGDRAKLAGLNKVGLTRQGFDGAEILALKQIYRELFLATQDTFKARLSAIKERPHSSVLVKNFLQFVSSTQRGLCLPRKGKAASEDE